MGTYRSLAAITAVYNEDDLLPQFLRHYGKECDAIFVMDNESTSKSATSVVLEYTSRNLEHSSPYIKVDSFSTNGRFDTVAKQEALMDVKEKAVGKFDYVMILDCDEFIVARDGKPIRSHLGDEPIYPTQGINLYEYPWDPPYDPRRPLIAQRRRGIHNPHYSKPVIVKPEHPVNYSPGCHFATGSPHLTADSDKTPFLLLHMRGAVKDIYLKRALDRTSRVDAGNPVDGHVGGGYYAGGNLMSFELKYVYESVHGKPFTVPDNIGREE